MIHRPKLKKLADRIYCLQFDNPYDLSMTFLRYQEYYESPKFRGKFFKISEFMEWYSKEYGDHSFTYPVDYVGFNLPSRALVPVIFKLRDEKYDQWTDYDQIMYETVMKIKKDMGTNYNLFYLIGVMKPSDDKTTLPHELAHSLFTVNPEYRRRMDLLLNNLSKRAWYTMKQKLKGRGYASNVFRDEAQAYLATGLHETMRVGSLIKSRTDFKKVFKMFSKNIL